jgi:hypothetical protein
VHQEDQTTRNDAVCDAGTTQIEKILTEFQRISQGGARALHTIRIAICFL